MDDQRVHDAYDVFHATVKNSLSFEGFRHKHLDNPYIVDDYAVCVDYQNGVPAGTNSFIGNILICSGKRLKALLSCDTAVLEEHRGKHIFTSMIMQTIHKGERSGVDLIIGFPNGNSYPGFVKMGFTDLGPLWTCASVMKPWNLMISELRHKAMRTRDLESIAFPAVNGHSLEMSLTCPFTKIDFDELNTAPGVHFCRSLAAFNWKIDSGSGKNAYFSIRKDSTLIAYFVVQKNCFGICYILDYSLPDDMNESKECIKIFHRAMKPYCNSLVVRSLNLESEEGAVMGKFFKIKKKTGRFILFQVPSDLPDGIHAELFDFSNWRLRYFDGDVILSE